jgi:hypothetical protein
MVLDSGRGQQAARGGIEPELGGAAPPDAPREVLRFPAG